MSLNEGAEHCSHSRFKGTAAFLLTGVMFNNTQHPAYAARSEYRISSKDWMFATYCVYSAWDHMYTVSINSELEVHDASTHRHGRSAAATEPQIVQQGLQNEQHPLHIWHGKRPIGQRVPVSAGNGRSAAPIEPHIDQQGLESE